MGISTFDTTNEPDGADTAVLLFRGTLYYLPMVIDVASSEVKSASTVP